MTINSVFCSRIVLTGASGFIGRQLVPRLRDAGCDLLLASHDLAALQAQYPGENCCAYDQIPELARDFALLLHLEVLSNDATASFEEFEKTNVDLLSSTLTLAKAANIPRFVNVTSFHALRKDDTPYIRSRRKGLEVVKGVEGIEVVNLFLPAVFGDDFSGKLSVVPRLPSFLRSTTLTFLTAMAPSIHIDRVAQFIVRNDMGPDRDIFLANPQDENFVFRVGKRLIDFLFIVGILGLFWWLLLIIWILIRLDSPGPGIFSQIRVGKDGKTFILYKFRTMKLGTRQAGTHEMSVNSVTRMGIFLRKTKLDELSQVFNVLLGDLSLIGPRPCLPVQVELVEERKRRGVLAVRPGISGLAQINHIDMSDPLRLAQWDARYVAQRSLPSELMIGLRTFLGRGAGDHIR